MSAFWRHLLVGEAAPADTATEERLTFFRTSGVGWQHRGVCPDSSVCCVAQRSTKILRGAHDVVDGVRDDVSVERVRGAAGVTAVASWTAVPQEAC